MQITLTPATSRFGRRKRHNSEQGQAAVFVVLAMGLFLIGGVGFVVDGANLWFHRQSAQTAADAACTAGAMNMLSVAAGADAPSWIGKAVDCAGKTDGTPNSGFPPCQYAAFNGYSGSALKASQAGTNVNIAPAAFSGISDQCDYAPAHAVCSANNLVSSPYIQVAVTDRVPTTFMRLIPGTGQTYDVGARTKCGLSNVLSPLPVVVLNPDLQQTMAANSNATLTILNGPLKSIQVNSTDPGAVKTPSGTVDVSQANSGDGGEFVVAAREAKSDAGGTIIGKWVNAAGVVSDPFASVPPPLKSELRDCTGGGCVSYGDKNPNVGCQDLTHGCDIYSAGYYPTGITVQKGTPVGASGIALFLPGIYYLEGNLSAAGNSCLRPAYAVSNPVTAAGDGSGGTMFYFGDTATVQVTSASGSLQYPPGNGKDFDCTSSTWAVPFSEAACPGTSLNIPSTVNGTTVQLTGNVLLGPCTGSYGDPLGNADPIGEQRGMLFFQNRDAQPLVPPKWHASGSFTAVGNLYFHYCDSTSPASTGSGANCSASAFTDVFTPGSGANAYIIGNVVVDQLQLGQSAGNSPIIVSLNPNAQYYTLKASLLQ